MRIVLLDGHTLNPGDLSWEPLEELGECRIYERTPPGKTAERAHAAEIVLTNKTVLDRPAIKQLDRLRYIGVLATGYNVVDVDAARQGGIVVTNVPGYAAPSVAQHTFALLLELTNRVGHHDATVREGRWASSPDFCYWDYPLAELAGLTMGIVGLGAIGQQVARIARAFGMEVIAHDPVPKNVPGVAEIDLDAVFSRSDVVTLHCPLTDETAGLVNAERLAKMKPTALLINTSRGQLVDEGGLAQALNGGRIAGAALDVLPTEPPPLDNALLSARNCFITPHQAWATAASRRRLLDVAVENVKAFLDGAPINVVS